MKGTLADLSGSGAESCDSAGRLQKVLANAESKGWICECQNNNKVKDWKRETPLAEILFLPGNDARKIA
jgi:hypothetical protein